MQARRVGILALLVGAAGCSSAAQGAPATWRRPVLVELFTSQGCSSCPPAERLVRELPSLGLGRERVIPLTFHVDYWDGLGWPDPFASRAFTERQEWYAHSGKLRSPDGQTGLQGLYTPQMVVDGRVHFLGQRRDTARQELERAGQQAAPFDVTVQSRTRGTTAEVTMQINPTKSAGSDRDWRVIAALTARQARTAVSRGENAGEVIEQAAVVRALSNRVPMPQSGESVRVRLTRPVDLEWANTDIVVFIQSETTHEIGAVYRAAATS